MLPCMLSCITMSITAPYVTAGPLPTGYCLPEALYLRPSTWRCLFEILYFTLSYWDPLLDAVYWTPSIGHRLLDAVYWTLSTWCCLPNAVYWTLSTGHAERVSGRTLQFRLNSNNSLIELPLRPRLMMALCTHWRGTWYIRRSHATIEWNSNFETESSIRADWTRGLQQKIEGEPFEMICTRTISDDTCEWQAESGQLKVTCWKSHAECHMLEVAECSTWQAEHGVLNVAECGKL